MSEKLLKQLSEQIDQLSEASELQIKEAAKQIKKENAEQLDGVKNALSGEITSTKEEVTKVSTEVKALDDEQGKIKASLQQIQVKQDEADKRATTARTFGGGNENVKSFNDILAETINEHFSDIKGMKKGNSTRSFRMKGFEDENVKEVKAVGDMSIGANFPNSGTFTTDVRNQIIDSPYNRVWLADILPGGSSSNSQSVLYPKENGGEGGADAWTDKTQDKPQMDFDLTPYSAYFKWIAGTVIIDREMLDDMAFMLSYIQNKMLISLKAAENKLILNGTGDSNPVVGLLTAATEYDGTYNIGVEKVLDAAWGQIVEDTEDFYNPTNVILSPRDAVSIGLNKAGGSGEYDLPAGSVGFVNGQLTIGGLQTVKTTQIGANNFLALDRAATMFIRRMYPELRTFEDAALAKKNKIMFRIEERATLAIFNNSAIVKGTLS